MAQSGIRTVDLLTRKALTFDWCSFIGWNFYAEMVLESDAEAEAEFCKFGDLTVEEILGIKCVFVWLASLQLCLIWVSPPASTLGFG